MTEQLTFSLNPALNWALVAFLFVFGCAGCSRWLNQLDGGAEIKNVKGTWRGRLVPISLVDSRGRTYEAAALEVEEGPTLPTPVPATQGGGLRPVLVTNTLPQR